MSGDASGVVVPEPEIGGGGGGGGGACTCRDDRFSRGMFSRVKECRHHSGLFYELISEGNHKNTVATDVEWDVGGAYKIKAGDQLLVEIEGPAHFQVSEYFRVAGGPVLLGDITSPFAGDKGGGLQLAEGPSSGAYLGNSANPGRRVLDWYEEQGDYQVDWSAGDAASPVAGLLGRYTRIGNQCTLHVWLTYAQPPAGGGDWSFSLPFAPAGSFPYCGSGFILRSGNRRQITAMVANGRVQAMTWLPSQAVAGTAPVPAGRPGEVFLNTAMSEDTTPGWLPGDQMAFSLTYEVAEGQ